MDLVRFAWRMVEKGKVVTFVGCPWRFPAVTGISRCSKGRAKLEASEEDSEWPE